MGIYSATLAAPQLVFGFMPKIMKSQDGFPLIEESSGGRGVVADQGGMDVENTCKQVSGQLFKYEMSLRKNYC